MDPIVYEDYRGEYNGGVKKVVRLIVLTYLLDYYLFNIWNVILLKF